MYNTFIEMITLLLCVLTSEIILVSSQSISGTNEGAGGQEIFCQFTGQSWSNKKNLYLFNIDDVHNALERCQNIMYTTYYFDRRNEINTHVIEFDKNALRSLTDCGKSIYLGISFIDYSLWAEIFTPDDDQKFNYHVNTLIAFLKKYKISGVIIQDLDVFYTDLISFETSQITEFVTVLKSKMESLKVGIFILGTEYALFSNSEIFNFECANAVFDYFFFDMSMLNDCSPETKCTSINPIISKDDKLITMELVTNAVANCKVDKCKAYAILLVSTSESPETVKANDDGDRFGTFTMLCNAAKNGGPEVSTQCFDSTITLYDQGKYASEHYSGILLAVIESDDYDNSCECRQFVAANTIIDGYECCSQQPCDTINNLLTS